AIDKALIDRASSLKFIARAGSGLDKMDVPYLEDKGVQFVNAPEGNRDSVGEHAVGMLLSLLHRLNLADLEVREKIWDREGNRGMELKGKTVGIYGYGFMGSALAEKLTGFGCHVIAYDKFKTGYGSDIVEECSLEVFQQRTQILSIHLPLAPDTANLFTLDYLREFPELMIILNTARGGVLDTHAVISLLREGRLHGVGLDVLQNEKLGQMTTAELADFEYLKSNDRVMLTPHVAGWSHESYVRINRVMVSKLEALGLLGAKL
ncbi:MAG: NAD(P)-dependent oxidoreductase, partial [Bacteroidota bacterium]